MGLDRQSGGQDGLSRDVTIQSRDSTSAVLKAGLEPGDRVVTAGVHSLVSGQSVKIPEEAPQ